MAKQFPWQTIFVLFLGVLVPTACVIWFMNEAVNNERLAVKQKMSAIYQSQIESVKSGLISRWQGKLKTIREKVDQETSYMSERGHPQKLFYSIVKDQLASSVILFSESGIAYPSAGKKTLLKSDYDFLFAQKLEFQERKWDEALLAYQRLFTSTQNVNLQSRAIIAQARCLSKLDKVSESIALLDTHFRVGPLTNARSANGSLLRANALLRILQLLEENPGVRPSNDEHWASLEFHVKQILEEMVLNYEDVVMPSSQRLFLMARLQQKAPSPNLAYWYKAESRATEFLEQNKSEVTSGNSLFVQTNIKNVWRAGSQRVGFIAIVDDQFLISEFQDYIRTISLPVDVEVILSRSVDLSGRMLAHITVEEIAPGWGIGMYSNSQSLFEDAAKKQISIYLWVGILIVLSLCIVMSLVAFYLSKQLKSSRLKNDLIATVSHELKTPLASIRLLVDTLNNRDYKYDSTTYEYLSLISKENQRLSQLIDNFLTFSRVERDQIHFQFKSESANLIANLALDAVKGRYKDSETIIDLTLLKSDLNIIVDKNMMISALINLLENACKYSGAHKSISLTVSQTDTELIYSILDRGVGIARQHIKRIFNRFYRVDNGLSRDKEGCGLGLSIVEFIVKSHGARVTVQSELGAGSCFSIHIPLNSNVKRM